MTTVAPEPEPGPLQVKIDISDQDGNKLDDEPKLPDYDKNDNEEVTVKKSRICSGATLRGLAIFALITVGFGLLGMEIIGVIQFVPKDVRKELGLKQYYPGFWYGPLLIVMGFAGAVLECLTVPWFFTMLASTTILLESCTIAAFLFYLVELGTVLGHTEQLKVYFQPYVVILTKCCLGVFLGMVIQAMVLSYFLWFTECPKGGCKLYRPDGVEEEETGGACSCCRRAKTKDDVSEETGSTDQGSSDDAGTNKDREAKDGDGDDGDDDNDDDDDDDDDDDEYDSYDDYGSDEIYSDEEYDD